jgi:hypothetical protein
MRSAPRPAPVPTTPGSPPARGHGHRQALMRRAVALAACVGLGAAGCSALGSASSSASLATVAAIPASAHRTGAGGANTAQVVAAAKAFLATLSDEQKDTVLYDFDDPAKKTGWSNFPTPVVARNGLKLGDLTDAQEAAALKVMEAALSKKGYEELVEIRKADDYLASQADSGGTPSAPPTGTPTGGPGGPGGGGRRRRRQLRLGVVLHLLLRTAQHDRPVHGPVRRPPRGVQHHLRGQERLPLPHPDRRGADGVQLGGPVLRTAGGQADRHRRRHPVAHRRPTVRGRDRRQLRRPVPGPRPRRPLPGAPRASWSAASPRSSGPRSPRCSGRGSTTWTRGRPRSSSPSTSPSTTRRTSAGAAGRPSTTTRRTYASTGRPPGSSSPTSPAPRPTGPPAHDLPGRDRRLRLGMTGAEDTPVRRLLPAFLIAAFLLAGGLASPAGAHPMSTSAVLLDMRDDRVEGEVQLPPRPPRHRRAPRPHPESVLGTDRAFLGRYTARHISAGSEGTVLDRRARCPVGPDDRRDAAPRLSAPDSGRRTDGSPPSTCATTSSSRNSSPTGCIVTVRYDFDRGILKTDDAETLGVFDHSTKSLEVPAGEGSWSRGFATTAGLGIEHVGEGADHLLFLLMLLIPAPLVAAGGRWRTAPCPRDAVSSGSCMSSARSPWGTR